MMNFLAKSLVLVHTVLSVCAMMWALVVFVQAKDLGWNEPRKEVLTYKKDTGEPKDSVRHASEIDKSTVALANAARTRDQLWIHVKPALEAIQDAQPHLYQNHLHYRAEIERLKNAPADEKLVVKRYKEGGLFVEIPLGKPVPDDTKKIDDVTKSFKAYQVDLKLETEIKELEAEITAKVKATKSFTAELTGTDETNMYLYPGLYQLADREFKAQSQLKVELDELKPYWSQALEQARQHRLRRTDLEATLLKLKAVLPKAPKQP